jgi:hypothetical protein
MLITPPPEGLFSAFSEAEATVAKLLDGVSSAVNEIDNNPIAQWIIPSQYRTMLTELARLLEGASKLLHEQPQ